MRVLARAFRLPLPLTRSSLTSRACCPPLLLQTALRLERAGATADAKYTYSVALSAAPFDDPEDDQIDSQAQIGLAMLAWKQGDLATAEDHFRSALALVRTRGWPGPRSSEEDGSLLFTTLTDWVIHDLTGCTDAAAHWSPLPAKPPTGVWPGKLIERADDLEPCSHLRVLKTAEIGA